MSRFAHLMEGEIALYHSYNKTYSDPSQLVWSAYKYFPNWENTSSFLGYFCHQWCPIKSKDFSSKLKGAGSSRFDENLSSWLDIWTQIVKAIVLWEFRRHISLISNIFTWRSALRWCAFLLKFSGSINAKNAQLCVIYCQSTYIWLGFKEKRSKASSL